MKVRIRKGDLVEVISGRDEDKGQRGEVIKVNPEDARVVVQGVNLRTKHQKKVQAQGRTVSPGKVRLEAPISISNVMVVCSKCHKPTRVGISREDGVAKRVCKQCGSIMDE